MECCWFDEKQCSLEAEVFRNIPLCETHIDLFQKRSYRDKTSTAIQSSNYHPIESFPGICYIVLLPTGYVKIGYSNNEKLFENRLKDLSRQYEAPVVLLAKLPGGFVQEAVLHREFEDDRIPGPGEVFRYSPLIAKFISNAKKQG